MNTNTLKYTSRVIRSLFSSLPLSCSWEISIYINDLSPTYCPSSNPKSLINFSRECGLFGPYSCSARSCSLLWPCGFLSISSMSPNLLFLHVQSRNWTSKSNNSNLWLLIRSLSHTGSSRRLDSMRLTKIVHAKGADSEIQPDTTINKKAMRAIRETDLIN